MPRSPATSGRGAGVHAPWAHRRSEPDCEGEDASPTVRTPQAIGLRIASGAVILASAVLYAAQPPSPDQWFLGYTGWRLTEGAIPYSGFADGNWPAAHWLHAASVLLLGNTPFTWRVFDFALMLGAVALASRTVGSLWGPRAGHWMLVLYPALYVVLGRWFAGERDVVGTHVLFGAIWFYWNGLSSGRVRWQLGTGALIALAALVKPTFAVFGPFLAAHAVFAVSSGMRSVRERLAHVAVAGAASVLGVIAGFGALLAQGTDLAQFRELAVDSVVVRYGSDTVPAATMRSVLVQNVAGSWHWITAGAVLGLGANLLRGGSGWAARNLLFPALWVTGVVTYVVQGQALGYTLGVLYAATIPVLCSGMGLISFPSGARLRRHVLAAALLVVPIAGTAKKWATQLRAPAEWLSGRITREAYEARIDAGDGISVADARALAWELDRSVPPDGTVLVWGRANAINFLARRPQPTRFHHNVTIMRRYLPERLASKWNAWFREEVVAHAPQACVVNERELDDTPPAPGSIVFLKQHLAEHYTRVRTLGDSGVYLRNQ